jgi:hypothetical protein
MFREVNETINQITETAKKAVSESLIPDNNREAFEQGYKNGAKKSVQDLSEKVWNIIKWPPGENDTSKLIKIEQLIRNIRKDLGEI